MYKYLKRKKDGRTSPTSEQETEVVKDEQLYHIFSNNSNYEVPFDSIDRWFRENGCIGGTGILTPVREGVEDRSRNLIANLLGSRAIGLLQERSRRAIVHHGTIGSNGTEEIQNIVDGISLNKSCQFIFLSWHDKCNGHIHAIHDCPYSNGSCRCFNEYIPQRKDTTRNKFDAGSKEYIQNAIFYNLTVGRWVCYIKVGATKWRSRVSVIDQPVGCQGGIEEGHQSLGLLEAHDVFCEVLRDDCGTGKDTKGAVNTGVHKNAGRLAEERLFGQQPERSKRIGMISQNILEIGTAPFQEFYKSNRWMEHPYMKYIDLKKTETKTAINAAIYKVINMSLYDIKVDYDVKTGDYIWGSEKYAWSCMNDKKFWSHYLGVEESFKILKKLLIWQIYPSSFRTDKPVVINFDWKPPVFEWVKWVINFLDGKTGKVNTLYLQSDPNAGKTLFLDCLSDHLKVVGNLKNWNRSNSFAIEELIGCKIAVWNEPNYEESVTPEMLKLLGGDRISVNKKYEISGTVKQIPVICSGNNYAFPRTPAFNFRINHCVWRSAPFLIDVGKKRLHPLAIEHLFNECEAYFEEEIRYNNHVSRE